MHRRPSLIEKWEFLEIFIINVMCTVYPKLSFIISIALKIVLSVRQPDRWPVSVTESIAKLHTV